MVLVNSLMIPIGTRAPDFRLPDTTGKVVSPADFKDAKGLLVMFLCNHCPYVKHIRSPLAAAVKKYQAQGIAAVGINSNDVIEYPEDGPEKMKVEVRQVGYTFPYLFDESQAVAKAYRATCTPDFFLFDGRRDLYYRGQFDSGRPGNQKPVNGEDLAAAVEGPLAGKPPPARALPSPGCTIKCKPGEEPDYFRGLSPLGRSARDTGDRLQELLDVDRLREVLHEAGLLAHTDVLLHPVAGHGDPLHLV